jgi:hypothetical protein
MAVRPDKRRKRLSVPDNEFFLHCLMRLGPPDWAAIDNHVVLRGGIGRMYGYIRETEYGQQFAEMVATFGEAKTRAPRWLYRYHRWWKFELSTMEVRRCDTYT